MAIALDSTASVRGNTASANFTHTVISNTNGALVVGTSVQDSNHANFPITSILYGASSLTKIRADEASGNNRTEIWYLLNPATGSNSISVSATGPIGELAVISMALTGVQQSGQPDAQSGNTGNSATASCSIVTVADNSWIFSMAGSEADFTGNGTSQTTIATLVDQGFENARGSYEGPKTPAGSDTQSFTLGFGASWAISSASFSPAAAAASNNKFLPLLGVGS